MRKQRHDYVYGSVEFPITCVTWLALCPSDPGARAPGGKWSRRRACAQLRASHLKIMWSFLRCRHKFLVPYWPDSLWTRLLWVAKELTREAIRATHRLEWVRGGTDRKRDGLRLPRFHSPQTFCAHIIFDPKLPVWKMGMVTMVPTSKEGCCKEKLINAQPLEMSIAQ